LIKWYGSAPKVEILFKLDFSELQCPPVTASANYGPPKVHLGYTAIARNGPW
jgi:hypothetical protein